MGHVVGGVLRGIPAAIVIALAFFVLVRPIERRLDRVATLVTGEVLPGLDQLKRERRPEGEPALPDQLRRALLLLEAQERGGRATAAALSELQGAVDRLKAEAARQSPTEPLARLSRQIARSEALLEAQENRVRGMSVVLGNVLQKQAVAAREIGEMRATLAGLRARLATGR